MNILVQEDRGVAVMDGSGIFRCAHDRAMIEKPCCLGEDCLCMGITSVYCPDCEGADLTADDVLQIIGV